MNPGVKMKGSIDSPKTPGGISKSLLTPCRRVGLSRNWGKKGASPFISPLSSADVKQEKVAKKRKICTSDDEESSKNELMSTPESSNTVTSNNVNNTPVRNIPLSKKKSKTLLMKEKKSDDNVECDKSSKIEPSDNIKLVTDSVHTDLTEPTTVSRSNSKLKSVISQEKLDSVKNSQETNDDKPNESINQNAREKSPNNLTKECIVVIQKKMIKNLGLDKNSKTDSIKKLKPTSQTLFDSEDETPLCELGKKDNINKNTDKEDFTDTKVKKLKDKNTSTTGLKKKIQTKQITKKPILEIVSQNSLDDDDDFECFNKKTILIKKSYDKIVKPNKAKSTGSITQRDIDEIKVRIEMKKKQLLVKTISEDTAELRDLIKKWQKGCQEALFELFDLMRKKFPEKQNMDYSEILQTLKIPPDLVGYDVENDCFVTPDDASIILSSINT